jgi:hypothetical protein
MLSGNLYLSSQYQEKYELSRIGDETQVSNQGRPGEAQSNPPDIPEAASLTFQYFKSVPLLVQAKTLKRRLSGYWQNIQTRILVILMRLALPS